MGEMEMKKAAIHHSCLNEHFSGVVYLKREERVEIERAYGYADRAEERLNTVHTRFGIASGCKLFTAVAICQLVEKGVLTLDTRLKDCLDIDFPHFDDGVTIHHLLTHTSGIPDYFDEEVMSDFEDLWKDRPVYQMKSPNDFLPLFQSNPLKFQPGERFHYNNAGYILLGLIIEQHTGRLFTEYVEADIFQKAGMKSSGYFPLDQLPKDTAVGYIDNKENHTWRTNIYSIPAKGGPDGGAFTSAPDMIAFWRALLGHQLLNEDMTAALLTPHVTVKDGIHYGYGVWMNQQGNKITKYHVMGYDPGVSFRSSFYPGHEVTLVLSSNQESGAFEMTREIEEELGLL
ncbi:serine hydrolase [Halobacillus sp. A5]|uniref:serine hydrolase domain-containing protein n=1 Tax=Halobacillus sp. A5 TaxID=2880263 RepID=UPI0020A69B58|nr:serine hydrolase [Halobacillus sp. A5]MCP3027693.1 beta-lactamase family protein [Halobacillus sp. A5]